MKIAIITGASAGLGKEFAKQIPRLYKHLDEIWLVARRGELLRQLEKEINIPVHIFEGDLERDYIYTRIARELELQSANIRMLVNNAGFGKLGDAKSMDASEQLEMIDLNCKALTRMTLLCTPYMSEGTRVVQVASAAAFAPQPGFSVYAATKSYVYSFSRSLCVELKERGITVTTVCPGPVDTEFFERAGTYDSANKYHMMSKAPEVVKQALLDTVQKKDVSVFGNVMKSAKVLAKFLPTSVVMNLMRKFNTKKIRNEE